MDENSNKFSQIKTNIVSEEYKNRNDHFEVNEYALDIFFNMNFYEEKFRISENFLSKKIITCKGSSSSSSNLSCKSRRQRSYDYKKNVSNPKENSKNVLVDIGTNILDG
jgi:hypothetical protein